MNEMEKAYEPSKYEAGIYELWEKSGAFAPADTGEPYTVLMPPPNANADLHLGHTLSTTLQDIMIRFARMNGKAALYVPGADHAGFETQVVFERHLAAKGKSRFDYPRQELYQQIWDFVQANKANMENQQRRIGASVDWSRNTFTLDPHVVKTAHTTFKRLWDDGLLYRGKRIVNYCTFHGTSFSELEVEYQNEKSHLWHIRYPVTGSDESIVVATTRPETMLGDTAVAVHPDDKRYGHLVGKTVTLPLSSREIPIVADTGVEADFGTGAVKVTPAHDPLDFEIGERHSLPAIEVIGRDGKMTDAVQEPYRGLEAVDARTKVVNDLTEQGFHVKTEDYEHSVGHCYKCGTVIQPLLLDQWLIRMQPLAKQAIMALESHKIHVEPGSKLKTLFQWLENIRDWNISRQIVWGIQIPAFISEDGSVIVDTEEVGESIERGGMTYHRDPDTFDTWFSSGQWPEVTLKYPDDADFKRFYPTAVMETGADLIFFWVARMVMLGLYLTGEVPFTTIYLHGLITDPKTHKKMSKSKGNVIGPTDLINRYGADALRMGVVANRSAGLNQGFTEKRVETYRNLSNKLWNVARYILVQIGDSHLKPPKVRSVADAWILEKFSRENTAITAAIGEYRFSEALEIAYGLLWNDLADWYLEASKVDANTAVLAHTLEMILKILHPFAPFVTEAIWQQLPWRDDNLISQPWPKAETADYTADYDIFERLKAAVVATRDYMAVTGLARGAGAEVSEDFNESTLAVFERLAGVKVLPKQDGARVKVPGFMVWLEMTTEQQRSLLDKLEKQKAEQTKVHQGIQQRLHSQEYRQKAPAEIIARDEANLETTASRIRELQTQLKAIGSPETEQ